MRINFKANMGYTYLNTFEIITIVTNANFYVKFSKT